MRQNRRRLRRRWGARGGAVLHGKGNKRSGLRRPLKARAGGIRGEGKGGSDTCALRGSKWREGGPVSTAHSRAGALGRQRCGHDRGGQRLGARRRVEERPGDDMRARAGKRKETENEFNSKLKLK
jgi:hypothetical protein